MDSQECLDAKHNNILILEKDEANEDVEGLQVKYIHYRVDIAAKFENR